MQVPILDGIYTDESADFRTSLPVNLVPMSKQTGISNGYLRPMDGIIKIGEGPGTDRGGINWDGVCYRVMGTSFVSISAAGTATTLGDVGGSGQVTLDYSFDYLAIASGGKLFLWNGTVLQQVTDADLGTVLDVLWVDGYFMTTDGESLVVTELNNPFAVDPLKYGSSEADPDPVKSLLKLRNEVCAINRYTMEMFDNVGGDTFPFQRIEGAQIQKGTIGTHSACVYMGTVAFLGGGRNEPLSIYLVGNGQALRIANQEIDTLLRGYPESQMANTVAEVVVDKGRNFLMFHLPDMTIVYDASASEGTGTKVWFTLSSSLIGLGRYRAHNFVWCYDKWLCADPLSFNHGYLTDAISSHWGNDVCWKFSTPIVYNEGRGAIFHEVELVCLTGRTAFGVDPVIGTSYSLDGETWSQEKYIQCGAKGERNKRLIWLQQGHMKNWRIQRFRGDSQAFISIARLDIRLEALGV